MKTLFAFIGLAALLLGSGCTTSHNVPKSTFGWNPRTGDVQIVSPKDTVLKNVVIMRGETNGMKFATIQIGEYSTHMSPEVIEKSGTATAQMINAGADAGAKYFALGLQTAAQAMGVPRLPAPAPPMPPTPTPPATNSPANGP